MDKVPLSQEEIDALLRAAAEEAADGDAASVKPGEVRKVVAQPVDFEPMEDLQKSPRQPGNVESISLILDVPMDISVELGRSRRLVRDILSMSPGSVVELDRQAGEPVDILVNGKLLARGEVVVIDENFGVRISEVVSKVERLSGLK